MELTRKPPREFVLFRNTTTPPTLTSLVTQINLCDPLPIPDEPKNVDLCEKGAVSFYIKKLVGTKNNFFKKTFIKLICRRTYVTKKIEDKDLVWVTNVQNIAVDSGE